ncbi:SGNH/GDSL hydrolase family protein [Streptomyces montanus]|uniref:SGNH/GDSL hydrolase family protein n=1 Tax=Streptomyces montanus TaxID=2580423 RepID=A0A5R9FU22_9ACTN|nr:SGNH/GDSL hydrolase family protein [Streptomyces montanus]TLS46129.1 SGNH/GDSL hydrolase family protein [Streptomyces montanus]
MLTLITAAAGVVVALAVPPMALAAQARSAFRRIILINRGHPSGLLCASGSYGEDHDGDAITIGILGDSLAAGLGADDVSGTPSALIGTAVATRAHRQVRIVNVARAGSGASDLARQADKVLAQGRLDIAVLIVGANDAAFATSGSWRERTLSRSAARIGQAIVELKRDATEVICCTCPDLGVVPGIPVPLRWFLRLSGRRLARLQRAHILRSGGIPVALAELASPEYAANPGLLSDDRFHPSSAGYEVSSAPVIHEITRLLSPTREDVARGRGSQPAIEQPWPASPH